MSLIQAILAVAMGLGLHFVADPIIRLIKTDSDALKLLSRYGTGVLGTWPVVKCFLRQTNLDEEDRKAASNTFLLSFIFVGIGVFVARAMRSMDAMDTAENTTE